MDLVLDTMMLGRLCHPNKHKNAEFSSWFQKLLEKDNNQYQIYIPEIADYELRRKLLHLIKKDKAENKSLERLNRLVEEFRYLPIHTKIMRRACEFWADARIKGKPTADESGLDGDVILAAQAESVGGIGVTQNIRHFELWVEARDWPEIII